MLAHEDVVRLERDVRAQLAARTTAEASPSPPRSHDVHDSIVAVEQLRAELLGLIAAVKARSAAREAAAVGVDTADAGASATVDHVDAGSDALTQPCVAQGVGTDRTQTADAETETDAIDVPNSDGADESSTPACDATATSPQPAELVRLHSEIGYLRARNAALMERNASSEKNSEQAAKAKAAAQERAAALVERLESSLDRDATAQLAAERTETLRLRHELETERRRGEEQTRRLGVLEAALSEARGIADTAVAASNAADARRARAQEELATAERDLAEARRAIGALRSEHEAEAYLARLRQSTASAGQERLVAKAHALQADLDNAREAIARLEIAVLGSRAIGGRVHERIDSVSKHLSSRA